MAEFTFEGQRTDEDVIFVLKRHPWVLSRGGSVLLVILAALVVLVLFFGFSKVTSIAIALAVIFSILYTIYILYLYNNYLYILTTERVIILEQDSLFGRKIIELELDKIQNITVEIKGVSGTMLNFGDVQIKTAGLDSSIILKNVENPYEVQQKITKFTKRTEEKITPPSPTIR